MEDHVRYSDSGRGGDYPHPGIHGISAEEGSGSRASGQLGSGGEPEGFGRSCDHSTHPHLRALNDDTQRINQAKSFGTQVVLSSCEDPSMIRHHALTHSGLRRKHNEDALLAETNYGVFAVADGVGGRAAGENVRQQSHVLSCG